MKKSFYWSLLIGAIALVGLFSQNTRVQAQVQCYPNDAVTYVSDADTQVNGNDAVVTDYPHSAWVSTVTSLASTNWIWDAEKSSPDDNGSHPAGTLTFTREFTITGNPTGAVLDITADNEYTVYINSNPTALGTDNDWMDVETINIPAIDLVSGLNTLTIVAVNDGPDGAGNPAGLNFELVVNSETCPEPVTEATLHAQKIVCDDESDLPNWGAGDVVGSIDADTASDWMEDFGAGLGCTLEDWDFEWSYRNIAGDPDDNTPGTAGANWYAFVGGEATVDVSNDGALGVRELPDADFISFTGQVTDQPVSAEVYCGGDVLHYDNWEWIDAQAGEDYYCVAWNVLLEQPEPNFCDGNLLVNGGFEEAEVTNGAMWELFASIPGWMVDWTDGNDNDTPMFELQEGVFGWLSSEGDQYIELDSDRPDTQANTKIWQDIATDDEKTYELSYQFSPRPNTLSADNTVEVYWNGNLVDTVGADNLTGNTVWTLEGLTGLAGVDSSSSLEFRSVGTSNEYGAFVDEVCLVEVPEEACTLDVYSDEDNVVLESADNAVATYDGNEAWTANIPDATWIWETEFVQNPTTDETKTFVRHFWWSGNAGDAASLTIATDNSSEVWLNGSSVAVMPLENNFGLETTYDVSSAIVPGVNEIVIEVKNWALADSTEFTNPAGALYKLSVTGNGDECEPEPLPVCSDDIDNDEDGLIDFIGGDLGCESATDEDETDEGPKYGPYCGDRKLNQDWEQCDPALNVLSIDDISSCNPVTCQIEDNQCSDLVLARVNVDNVQNWNPEGMGNPADMTSDVYVGGDVEGVNNIPEGTYFPVFWMGETYPIGTDDPNINLFEDVEGLAVARENGFVKVRMHGSHGSDVNEEESEGTPKEHVDGTIEITHAFSNTSVLTDMRNELGLFNPNRLEKPFVLGQNLNPGNDEIDNSALGELADGSGFFWMTTTGADDGFNADYTTEELCSTGDVTICKQDEDGAYLPGWTVMLKKGGLIQNLSVDSTDEDGTDSITLDDYTPYIAIANGEWNNQGGANVVDPEYSTTDGWLTQMDGYTGYAPEILELNIGGDFVGGFGNWGAYNSAHTYAQGFMPDADEAVPFVIFDGEAGVQNSGWYDDNSGSLNVDIYEGYVGTTGQSGCYTFYDVPVGEYTVDEIMQDGWSHDEEAIDDLGPVTVNGEEEFHIINDEEGEYEEGGSITIWKQVEGIEVYLGSFDFTFGDGNFDLSDGNSEVLGGLSANEYVITEEDLGDEWSTTISCEGDVSYGDNGSGQLTVTLGDEQDVTCTFTNTYDDDHEGNECLVEGFKKDQNGVGLEGWYIGLNGYFAPYLESLVINEYYDITGPDGYYCIEGNIPEYGSDYSVYEIIQDGWENIGAEVDGSDVVPVIADGHATVSIDSLDTRVDFFNQLIDVPDSSDDTVRRSGSNRNSFGGGEVLGASTETNFCPFLRDYQHINIQNDPSEVNKAKAFFNAYLGLALTLNGTFDMSMFNAVVQFQNMFKPDVLDTWTEEFPGVLDDSATGYLYQTTKWKINSIICPGYETFPDQLIMAPGTTVN